VSETDDVRMCNGSIVGAWRAWRVCIGVCAEGMVVYRYWETWGIGGDSSLLRVFLVE